MRGCTSGHGGRCVPPRALTTAKGLSHPLRFLQRKLDDLTTHLYVIIFIWISVFTKSEILIEKSSLCLASYNIYFHKIISIQEEIEVLKWSQKFSASRHLNFPVMAILTLREALKIKCRHLQISAQYGFTSPCFYFGWKKGYSRERKSLHRKLLDKARSMPRSQYLNASII